MRAAELAGGARHDDDRRTCLVADVDARHVARAAGGSGASAAPARRLRVRSWSTTGSPLVGVDRQRHAVVALGALDRHEPVDDIVDDVLDRAGERVAISATTGLEAVEQAPLPDRQVGAEHPDVQLLVGPGRIGEAVRSGVAPAGEAPRPERLAVAEVGQEHVAVREGPAPRHAGGAAMPAGAGRIRLDAVGVEEDRAEPLMELDGLVRRGRGERRHRDGVVLAREPTTPALLRARGT